MRQGEHMDLSYIQNRLGSPLKVEQQDTFARLSEVGAKRQFVGLAA